MDPLATRLSGPEPESDIPRAAGVARLPQQHLRAGVQVVWRDPAVVAEIAADRARVEVDGLRMLNVRQQESLCPGVRERGPAELTQQFEVLLARASDRADNRRDVRGEHGHDPAQVALDRQDVDDVRLRETGGRPGLLDVVNLEDQLAAQVLD